MESESWRWIWLACAVIFGIGEIFTAGFFMLPFAGGAVVAFILAWFKVAAVIQLVVFLVVSVLALIGLRRVAARSSRKGHAVGANRYLDKRAVVLEKIDRVAATGRVRMDTELWRATTDGDPIEEGTEVRVVEVRGTRLVVKPQQ
jgi:membrane protein implicated in regulation of membrane protease activity